MFLHDLLDDVEPQAGALASLACGEKGMVLTSIPVGLIFLVFYVLHFSRRVSQGIAADQQQVDKEP